VTKEAVLEVVGRYFDVPPEQDSEPLGFHEGWELCARAIAAAIRAMKP
jgi:hypothetical protein